jgi:hypothetical protein
MGQGMKLFLNEGGTDNVEIGRLVRMDVVCHPYYLIYVETT